LLFYAFGFLTAFSIFNPVRLILAIALIISASVLLFSFAADSIAAIASAYANTIFRNLCCFLSY